MPPKKNIRKKIGLVVSEFNNFVSKKLLKSCLVGLKEFKIPQKQITVVKVPGAFEIPLAVQRLIKSGNCAVVIALGCVIKGETYHFEQICRACVDGIMAVQLKTGVPIVFEVLMVDRLEDALKRASDKLVTNKGYIGAKVAVSLIK